MSVKLLYSQRNAFVELPKKSLEELKDMLEKAKERNKLYNSSIPQKEMDDDHSVFCEVQRTWELVHDLEVEIVRQEENLGAKTIEELKDIYRSSHRRIKQMENYEWDVVEQSSEENQKGFQEHISYLETLAGAASLELDRREHGFA